MALARGAAEEEEEEEEDFTIEDAESAEEDDREEGEEAEAESAAPNARNAPAPSSNNNPAAPSRPRFNASRRVSSSADASTVKNLFLFMAVGFLGKRFYHEDTKTPRKFPFISMLLRVFVSLWFILIFSVPV